MAERLSGKKAMVTAAGQGIGRAIAEAFAREGARVYASDLDPAKLDGLDRRVVTTGALDVTDGEAVRRYAASVGSVDVLVNCAGWVHHGTILDAEEEDWDHTFELNLRSMFRMIRAVLPGMLSSGGGTILNIASVVSSIKAAPNRAVYAASKAGVIGLSKAVQLISSLTTYAATRFVRAPSTLPLYRIGSWLSRIRNERALSSSRASRWAVSGGPTRWRNWPYISPRTKLPSSPGLPM